MKDDMNLRNDVNAGVNSGSFESDKVIHKSEALNNQNNASAVSQSSANIGQSNTLPVGSGAKKTRHSAPATLDEMSFGSGGVKVVDHNLNKSLLTLKNIAKSKIIKYKEKETHIGRSEEKRLKIKKAKKRNRNNYNR